MGRQWGVFWEIIRRAQRRGRGGGGLVVGTMPFWKCKYMDQRSCLKQIEDHAKLSWVLKCALDYFKITPYTGYVKLY